MFSKIIFVLATVCVVNASVLTVNVFEDDPKTQDVSNPKDCNYQECDQLCRRLKFRGGACVNGRCKCDNFLNAEDEPENTLSDLEDSVLQKDDHETEAKANLSRCILKVCDLVCRWLNKTNGSCVDGRCKCANSIVVEDAVTGNTLSNLEDSILPKRCTYEACNELCRKHKFPGGTCVNGRCKCDNFFGTEDVVGEYSEFAPRRVCRLTKCSRKCTRRGYESGSCVDGRCKCFNNLQEKGDISETSLPVSELSEDQTKRGCNFQACQRLCRKLMYPGGSCFKGRCKCDNFFGTEDAVDEYSELATRRICDLRKCNRTCTRRGYERARCVNGWCKCYNKIQRQDASLLADVTSYENEESNDILRSNEEELIVPSPSACKILTCMQMCYRLKYDVGWCLSGRCHCYKN